jgi:hypothetical protein
MKKKMILVGLITVVGLGMFLASCKKDKDDGPTGCICSYYDDYYGSGTDRWSASEMKEYGYKNCKELEMEEDYNKCVEL